MLISAEQKYSRQTPTRLRMVAGVVRDQSVLQAMDMLRIMPKKSAQTLLKVFKQAVANARHNFGYGVDALEIKEIMINEGPRYRRYRAVSRGRAHNILKRTSHVKVVLQAQDMVKEEKKAVKAAEVKAPEAKPAAKTAVKAAQKKETKKTEKKVQE